MEISSGGKRSDDLLISLARARFAAFVTCNTARKSNSETKDT
jgi:hypothetical protein